MKSRKLNKTRMILILLLSAVTLGFALLFSDLNINGIGHILAPKWKILWNSDSIVVNDKSVEGPSPVVNEAKDEVEYTANLKEPGDFYEFTIDAKNYGTIDGMITDIEVKFYDSNDEEIETPYYLENRITNSDGTSLDLFQPLRSHESHTYKVRLEYSKNIDPEDLPKNPITFKSKITITYEELDDRESPDNVFVRQLCNGEKTYNQNSKFLVTKVEDLVCLSKVVNEGTTFSGATINQYSDLDIKDKNSYNQPKSEYLGDINEDGTVEDIIIELSKEKGFKPIGNSTNKFQGTYKGNNKTISNLYINRPDEDYIGLFGYTTTEITGLNIENTNITGKHFAGSLVAYTTNKVNDIKVENIQVTGNDKSIGGVIGCSYGDINQISLKNATITSNSNNLGGIVGWTNKKINKISLENINIEATGNYVGGIAGIQENSNAVLDDLSVDGLEITSIGNYVGGLFGQTDGKITRMFNNLSGIKVKGNDYTGGLVGQLNRSTVLIETIVMSDFIEVEGHNYVGGLVGSSNYNSSWGIINEVKFKTKVKGNATVGGLIGYGIIRNVIGETYVEGISSSTGGLDGTGVNDSEDESAILEKGSSNKNTFGAGVSSTELFYYNTFTSSNLQGIEFSSVDKNISAYETAIDTKIGGDNDGTGYYFDFDENQEIQLYKLEDRPIQFTLSGSGTESDPYLIHNVQEWNEATSKAQQVGVHFKIVNDIDFTNKEIYKMGGPNTKFSGTIDGDNHTLTGITFSGGSYTGLIGYATSAAKIKDLTITNSKIEYGKDYVGMLIGYDAGATIDNVNIDTSNIVAGRDYVGLIAGYTTKGVSNKVYENITTVSGRNYVGSIYGYTTGKIENVEFKNISITATGNYAGGVTGYATGKINNVKIENTNISGTGYVGGVVGYASNEINNITIKDLTINATEQYAGGVAGLQYDYTIVIDNLSVDGITITGTSSYTGGLFGQANGKIKKMLNNIKKVKVTGNDYVGGLVGNLNSGLLETVELKDVIEVSATGNRIGGLIGSAPYSTINEVKFNTKVSGNNYVGGVLGMSCTATKNVIGSSEVEGTGNNVGGIIGSYLTENESAILESGSSTGGSFGNTNSSTKVFYFEGYTASTYQGIKFTANDKNISAYETALDTKIGGDNDGTGYYFDFDENQEIHLYKLEDRPIPFTLSGSGTEADPYLIHNVQEWNEATSKAQQVGVYYKIVNDIDFTNKEIYKMGGPFTKFSGTIDGDNHTLTGITFSGGSYTGLIGYATSTAKIKDLTITNSKIEHGKDYVGMLVGYNEGITFKNITLDGNEIDGMNYIGGTTGYSKNVIYEIELNNTIINGTNNYIGGISGYTTSQINEIELNNINISATGHYIGGIAGQQANSSAVLNDVNISGIEVTTTGNYVGGLYGQTNGSIIKQINTISNIKVTGNSNVGGLVGFLSETGKIETIEIPTLIEVNGYAYVGGLVGRGYTSNHLVLDEIVFNTKVTATGTYVGGVLGDYGKINNVIGSTIVYDDDVIDNIGGIDGNTISSSESAILLSGSSNKYGFSRYNNSSNVYYFNDYIATTPQGTLWPDAYKNDLQQYSQAIETEYTGDLNKTGYYFGLIDGDTNIHIIPSKNTSETTPLELSYEGFDQAVKVTKTGKYKLEVWGAQGGSTKSSEISSTGGYGAYSIGYINLEKNDLLYVIVGGQGKGRNIDDSSSTATGGYNGGASGSGSYNAGGGGATHIATRPGLLASLSKNRNSIIIVAGGGGGGHTDSDYRGYDQKGGNAGGYVGMYAVQIEGSCNSSCTRYNYPSGGTQTSGGLGVTSWSSGTTSSTTYVGTFGQGGTGSCYGGGGGGFYGGASGEHSGGGGGSGYIANGNLSNKAMYCYDCEESIADATKTIANGLVSDTPQPMYSKIGDGYARITYIND